MTAQIARRKGWSRIGQLAKSAAISQANRARSERDIRPWSAREMKIAMQTYPDYKRMMELLPDRRLMQCKKFCATYGIVTKRHVWTNVELKKLRALWEAGTPRAEMLPQFPLVERPDHITSVARHYGFKRPKRTPKVTGHPIIDAIRAECFARAYTMADLDEWCGSGRYWYGGTSFNGTPNWKHITKAIEILGGQMNVVWSLNGATP
jgi:hypothetical protein